MCGIGGYAFIPIVGDEQKIKIFTALTALAYELSARGTHAWGSFSISKDSTSYYKVASSITESYILPASLPEKYILHTRFGTTGSNESKNAHPFIFGNVIGVHNGMIGNHHSMNQLHNRKFEVDSMHIFANLESNLPLSEIEGYGAIVYQQDKSFRFGVFNGGELALAQTPMGWWFGSTKSILKNSLRIADIKILRFWYPDQGILYEMNAKALRGKNPKKIGILDVKAAPPSQKFGGKRYDIYLDSDYPTYSGYSDYPTHADSDYPGYKESREKLDPPTGGYISNHESQCAHCGSLIERGDRAYWLETDQEEICIGCKRWEKEYSESYSELKID